MPPDDLSPPPPDAAQRNGAGAAPANRGAPPLTPLRVRQCSSCDDTGEVQQWSDIAAGRYDRLSPCPACDGRGADAGPASRFFGLPQRYAAIAAWSFKRFDCAAHDAAPDIADAADSAAAAAALRRNLEGALREARRWASGGRGWLVLFGPSPGCGKTHLAGAALRERIETHGEQGAFVDVPLLVESLRPNGHGGDGHALRARLRSVPVLVLDNLGAEYQTAWSASELALLLRERHRQELATAVTCATLPADPAVRSLLADQQHSRIFRISAGDYRLLAPQHTAQP